MAETSPPTPAEIMAANAPSVKPGELKPSALPTKPETASTAVRNEEQPQENLPRARRNELVEGGEDIELALTPQTQKTLTDRMERRRQVSESLSQQERPLSAIDKLLLKLGPDSIDRIRSGQLDREDAALAYYVLYDELIEKSMAAGKLTGVRITSEYTREIGFDKRPSNEIQDDLTNLNNLRIALEQSLFGKAFREPVSNPESITDFIQTPGSKLHDRVINQLTGPEGVLTQRHNAKSFLEVYQEDSVAAMQALHEANERALTEFASDTAFTFLSDEKPSVDKEILETHAKKLEEPPKPEDVTPLEEAVNDATEKLNEVEATYKDLKTQRETTNKELPTIEKRFLTFKSSREAQEPRLTIEINNLETRIAHLERQLVPTPGGATDGQKVEHAKAMATITSSIDSLSKTLGAKNDALNKIITEYNTADAESTYAKKYVTFLDSQIQAMEETDSSLKNLRTSKKTAETNLKNKRDEIAQGGSIENKKKALALRRWGKVIDKYGDIIDTRFSQEHGSEFTRERLANTARKADGQIEGAELIREHILGIIDRAGFDPALARKMLSDETIARAIIWNYQVDTGRPIDTSGNTIEKTFSSLENSKNDLANESAKKNPDANIVKNLEETIRNQELTLLNATLPYLRGSQFEVGNLVRMLVREGLNSAEKGNPYLELSDYYKKTQPELKLEAESIYRRNVGQITKWQDRQITWEGDIFKFNSRNNNEPVPTHYRVSQKFDRNKVDYNVEARVNMKFLQALPDTWNPNLGLPPEAKNLFYDLSGNLRTELRGPLDLMDASRLKIPQWISVAKNTVRADTNAALADLSSITTPNIEALIPASVADYLLQKTPQERLNMLKGLSVGVEIDGVLGNDYMVDLDNKGNLMIYNKTDNQQAELGEFYKRAQEQYRQKLGVQTLDADQRADLQMEFLKIQEALGREILRAQQRR